MLELLLGAAHLVAVAEASIAIPNVDCRGGLVDMHAAGVQLPPMYVFIYSLHAAVIAITSLLGDHLSHRHL